MLHGSLLASRHPMALLFFLFFSFFLFFLGGGGVITILGPKITMGNFSHSVVKVNNS